MRQAVGTGRLAWYCFWQELCPFADSRDGLLVRPSETASRDFTESGVTGTPNAFA